MKTSEVYFRSRVREVGEKIIEKPVLERGGRKRSRGGKEPITLSNGEQRRFVEDGDRIILKGYCGDDQHRIGLGQVDNVVIAGSLK